MLLAGAGWYPHVDTESVTYTLRVEAPAGMVAVTAGRSLGTHTAGGKTVSTWQVDYPVRGLALSAAAYEVRKINVRKGLTAETYFLAENRDLADTYLTATADYIRLYESLFGEYPFEKFAVVENFFPTGYGFPSYTLLGGRVLRLPFIVHTSLGHEIAHCWWGNGVYVDADQGNWSEALATYVADYFYKERESAEAAREYRRQMLRNYATLVDASNDFALKRFVARTDPVSKTIGYDKGAMVFHMLRRHIGDAAFWAALRDVYRDRRFESTAWGDLQRAFERRAGESLGWFFRQWVDRDGAPDLRLTALSAADDDPGWVVRGQLAQTPPYFDVSGILRVRTARGDINRDLASAGPTGEFTVACDAPPRTVIFDPDVDVFRRLAAAEIPATVNSLKGAESVLVVLTDPGSIHLRPAAETLVAALGLYGAEFIAEKELDADRRRQRNLLFIGLPPKTLFSGTTAPVDLRSGAFVLDGTVYDSPADAFFGVFAHPDRRGGVIAVFLPLSEEADAGQVARLVTHYGKYSYLIFHQGRNRVKGTWPVSASPVVYRWPHPNRSEQEKR